MAYMGYCTKYHHLHASTSYTSLYQYFLDHNDKHEALPKFHIGRISAKEYQDWLRDKDNPAFWEAWRDVKKMSLFCLG